MQKNNSYKQMSIIDILCELDSEFTMKDAYAKVDSVKQVNHESIRARIYEAIDKGVLKRISKGIFQSNDCLLIQGDGRDLSFLQDNSIDAIITDHPYDISKSNKGGNRNFTSSYNCFQYTQKDFLEKARVLKDGHFLVEFLPEENADNYEYIFQIKQMAKKAGLFYWAEVPYKKKGFVSNCGRKSKDTEQVMIFVKGKAMALRPDAKKDLAEPGVSHFMSGTTKMLPTCFEYEKPKHSIHQSEKPVELIEDIISYITEPHKKELILDSFAGSGVLGEACRKMKKKSILIEYAKEFVDIISYRLNLEPVVL